jgi:hypothetical protein
VGTEDTGRHWRDWFSASPPPPSTEKEGEPIHILPILPSLSLSPILSFALLPLLTAPVLSYTSALTENLATCPKTTHDRQVNPDQYANEREFWGELEDGDIRAKREGMGRYLERLEREGKEVVMSFDRESTRGIVMTGGNQVHFSFLLSSDFRLTRPL